MVDKDFLIALSAFDGFGPVRLKLLLDYFGTSENVWKAKAKKLNEIGLGNKTVDKFTQHKAKYNFKEQSLKLKRFGIKVYTKSDPEYPENLAGLPDAPFVLYVKGGLMREDRFSVAVVGTRQMTMYGKAVAEKFSAQLAMRGVTVVSGLALGIDTAAQKAAYFAGGRTVSVLASGLDIITPLINRSFALDFIKEKGALVSEHPPGYEPKPFDFPVRDRIIAGLAKAVLVIEGKMKSGTFYTVKAAADYGRPVFAVPGPVTSPASEGPNYLISNGAHPALKIEDILEELGIGNKPKRISGENLKLSKSEEELYKLLSDEPLHLDEIVRISGVPTAEISARLTIMEMKGLVKNLGGGSYARL